MARRLVYIIGLILVIILLAISYYLQFFENIIPCPLCLMQRFCFLLLSFLFFLGYILPNKLYIHIPIQILCIISSILGIFFAGRNIWLQHYPHAGDECAVNLFYMLQTFPFIEFIQKLFIGSNDCSQIGFEFLRLNMAEWALFWFFIFFLMSVNLLFKNKA